VQLLNNTGAAAAAATSFTVELILLLGTD